MSLINNKSFILDDEEDKDIEEYVLPSIVTSKPEVIPIKKSLAISSALHPAAVLLIWLITVALALMGINLSLFKKPQAQLKKDIEFVLVDKEAKPRDPNTRNRADMNSKSKLHSRLKLLLNRHQHQRNQHSSKQLKINHLQRNRLRQPQDRHPDLYLLRHLRRNHHQALLFLHLKVHRLVKPFLLVL